ncbi:MAG TPA: beta-galactosidase, partial [Polyangiales bacterium]|nr:beta-galactosidase [Polyangiales bacterium]
MTHQHFSLSGDDARITDGPDGALFRGIDFEPRWYTEDRPLHVYGWRLRRDARVLARAGRHPLAMARMHGQGRILLLGWDGTLGPRRHAGRTRLEHNSALALRALSFAARKEPEVLLDLSQPRISAGEPGLVSATLTAAAQLELTVRDEAFRSLRVLTVDARAGENALRLPPLAQGSYFLQAIARDPHGRVLTWGDQKLIVDGAEHLTVNSDKEIYRIGDTARISARLQNSAELTASLTVRDATGRVLARQQRAFRGEVQFDYAISAALVAPHRATVEVSRGDSPLVQAAAQFFVPNMRWDDYENVYWPMSRIAPTSRLLRDEAGMTALFDGLGQDAVSAEVAHFGQHIGRMNDGAIDVGLVQTQPLTAARAPQQMVHRAIEAAKRYGSLMWILQDERHQSDDPGAPDTEGLQRYREYLRAQYGSLAALNKSWAARYAAWDEVQPTLTAAVQSGTSNLAPWLDFRLYVADQAYQLDARLAHEIRAALGTDARIGIDGFTTSRQALPYAAIDFGRLAADGVFDLYVPYNDDFVLASLIKGPKAKYVGASMARAEYFGAPWRDAFRGHWGTLRFFGPTFVSELGHLQPAGRWTGESTRELRQGVGKLLIGSERELSPVVVLYNYPALVANSGAHLWDARHGGAALAWAAGESREVFEQLLWAAGVSFGYQTDGQ